MRNSRRPAILADVTEAIYRTVHDFGADRLAAMTGQTRGVIYNKANPRESSLHKPTIDDLMVWQSLTKDHRIVRAMAAALGEACFEVPQLGQMSDAALLEIVLTEGERDGEFHGAINQALADGKFTRAEYQDIRRRGYEVIAAVAELMSRVEGMVDE